MELFYELLLTAVFSLFAAFLLGKLFAADDRRPEPAGDRVEEEEKIIEVDAVEVKQKIGVTGEEGRADMAMAPTEKAESWIEDEDIPAKVMAEKLESLIEEEQVPAKAEALSAAEVHDWAAFLDLGLDEQKVRVVGEKQHDLAAEAASREVLDVELEGKKVRIAEAKQHDLVAEAAPREVLDVEGEKVRIVGAKQHDLAAEAALKEFPGAGLEEEKVRVVGAKQHDLAAEASLREVFDVELKEEKKEELQEQPVEEAPHMLEEVESQEDGKCEPHVADQEEALVAKEKGLVVKKADGVELGQEGESDDKTVTQLPEMEGALQEVSQEDLGVDMEFGEWEGIERSEVEKRFGAAAAFAGSDVGVTALSKLSSDVQLHLQGLLKVAIDGPCYDTVQPLALRPSSRAKWVAWQKLGNMNPEVAMEQYMTLLSQNIPEWMGEQASDIKQHEPSDSEGSILMPTSGQQSSEGNKDSIGMGEGHITSGANPDKGIRSNSSAE